MNEDILPDSTLEKTTSEPQVPGLEHILPEQQFERLPIAYQTDVLETGMRIKNEQKAFLQQIDEINDKRTMVKQTKCGVLVDLYKQLPLNDLGLPNYIYSADLIPSDLASYSSEERAAILSAASISLDYSQGYPTLPSGHMLWGMLAFEPKAAYETFIKYIEIPELNPCNPVRDLPAFSKAINVDVNKIAEYAVLFCWQYRTKAYDLFRIATHKKAKEQKALQVENRNYELSTKVLDRTTEIMGEILNDPIANNVKLRDLISLFKVMTDLQKDSLSQNRGGGAQATVEPQNASLEVTLKTIAHQSGERAKTIDNSGQVSDLLHDPEALAMAQELIIRTTR